MSVEFSVNDRHRLDGAAWTPSHHCAARPQALEPELIVLHCVSLPENEFGTGAPQRLFTGALDCSEHPSFHDLTDLQVAPHLFIDRLGGVEQFVAFDQQAWHAGLSAWRGRSGCNDFSVGIELEGSVSQAFTDAQYDALVAVLVALLERYPGLSVGHLVGHQDIAPGRKTDPGPLFDWAGLLRRLHAELADNAILT